MVAQVISTLITFESLFGVQETIATDMKLPSCNVTDSELFVQTVATKEVSFHGVWKHLSHSVSLYIIFRSKGLYWAHCASITLVLPHSMCLLVRKEQVVSALVIMKPMNL